MPAKSPISSAPPPAPPVVTQPVATTPENELLKLAQDCRAKIVDMRGSSFISSTDILDLLEEVFKVIEHSASE